MYQQLLNYLVFAHFTVSITWSAEVRDRLVLLFNYWNTIDIRPTSCSAVA